MAFQLSDLASSLTDFVNRSTDVLSDTLTSRIPSIVPNCSDTNNNTNSSNLNSNRTQKPVQASASLSGFPKSNGQTSATERLTSDSNSKMAVRRRSTSQQPLNAAAIPECRLDPFDDDIGIDADDNSSVYSDHPSSRDLSPTPNKQLELLDPQTVWRKYSAGNSPVVSRAARNLSASPQTRKHSFAGFGCQQAAPPTSSSWLQLPDLNRSRATSLTPAQQYLPDALKRRMSSNSQLLELAHELERTEKFIENHEQLLRDMTPSSRKASAGSGINSLGSINPDLYKDPIEGELTEYPPGHIGRLWMTLIYDDEKLSVQINKVRNLPPRPGSTDPLKSCDPYVRLTLDSVDPSACAKAETKAKRKTTNPTFGETFIFEIDHDMFDEGTLKVVVVDVTPIKRHVPIGCVTFPLSDYTICKQHTLAIWRDLKKEEPKLDCSDMLGNVTLSLCYHSDSQKVSVHLIEASDLVPTIASKEPIDTYCKVTFLCNGKQLKQKKSKVVKKSLHPVYNETFDCKITSAKLGVSSVIVQVMQHKSKQIGFLELTSDTGGSVNSGKHFEQWQSMCKQPNTMITDTHALCL